MSIEFTGGFTITQGGITPEIGNYYLAPSYTPAINQGEITIPKHDNTTWTEEAFAGTVGYIQGTGSAYAVQAVNTGVELLYNDVIFSAFTNGDGFSGSVYGIGNVTTFSSSVDYRLSSLASTTDAGVWA